MNPVRLGPVMSRTGVLQSPGSHAKGSDLMGSIHAGLRKLVCALSKVHDSTPPLLRIQNQGLGGETLNPSAEN